MPKKHYQKVEELWKKVIKLRARMESELGGVGEQLHAHHILGKPNYALRFDLSNGIALTGGEHGQCHNAYTQRELRERCLLVRGVSYEHLKEIGKKVGGLDLFKVEDYLKAKIKEYGG